MKRKFCATAIAALFITTVSATAATTLSSTDTDTDLGSVLVTATRFTESVANLPVNVTVIDAEAIRQSTAQSIPELLGQQAGVRMSDFYGTGAVYTSVDIRGFGATASQNTLILLDGRRLTDMDSATVNWASIPMASIERIEILRGAGAVAFGDGASGGVINIMTRSPDAVRRAGVALASGSYGQQDVRVDFSQRIDGIGIALNAGRHTSDGYRENNKLQQDTASLKLDRSYDNGSIRLGFDANQLDMRLPSYRLVTATSNDLARDRRGTPTPKDDSGREGNQWTVDWRHQLGWAELALDLTHRTRDQWIYSQNDDKVLDSDLALDSISPRLRIPHTLFGGAARLIVGADWQRWDYAAHNARNRDLLDHPFSSVNAKQTNDAWFVQETVAVNERTNLLVGMRSEKQTLTAENTVDRSVAANCPYDYCPVGASPDAASKRETAWEAGLRYRLSSDTTGFVRAGRSFRFGNIDETYELNASYNVEFQFLRPQVTRSNEIGLEWDSVLGMQKLAYFQNDVIDEIHLDAYSAGIGNTNLPPSRRRGIELESEWRVSDALSVNGNYTWTDARFLKGSLMGANISIAGKQVPLVAKHMLDVSMRWHFTAATQLLASVNYVGKQYMDNDEGNDMGLMIPAHTVANIRLEQNWGAWRGALAVANLFNEKYYNYAVKSQFTPGNWAAYPMPERSMTLSAEYRFD